MSSEIEGGAIDAGGKMKLRAALTQAFSPGAPVTSLGFFSGRLPQRERLLDAVLQRGRHAAIYGERGVGKTSLANVLPGSLEFLGKFDYQIVRHNCSASSNFGSIWESVLRELAFKASGSTLDLRKLLRVDSFLPPNAGPEDVRFLLQQAGSPVVVIVDEYDRVPDRGLTSSMLSDTIKSLSDHSVDATLIIIGIADSVDELIAEHKSIERALVQVKMPRMTEGELLSIVEVGFRQASMSIGFEARCQIAALSQGLPHNAHSLGLLTGFSALECGCSEANRDHVDAGIRLAVQDAQQTLVTAYCQAVASSHESIYKEILLAAALACADDLGYFSAKDLRKPLSSLLRKNYGIDAYMRHLNAFCKDSRGKVLQRCGERRSYRFRFSDPLMEPYVIMRGIAENVVDKEAVLEFESENLRSRPLSLF